MLKRCRGEQLLWIKTLILGQFGIRILRNCTLKRTQTKEAYLEVQGTYNWAEEPYLQLNYNLTISTWWPCKWVITTVMEPVICTPDLQVAHPSQDLQPLPHCDPDKELTRETNKELT